MMHKIKVLIVDDSSMFRKVMEQILSSASGIEVIGFASDAGEAGDKIIRLKPDVVTLDVVMPNMSGIEFLKLILPHYPVPVVMVSALGSSVFDAMNAGAVDFVAKPDAVDGNNLSFFASELITKIKIASIARLGQKRIRTEDNVTQKGKKNLALSDTIKLIAIGASTGGTEAISQILCELPTNTPGVLVVQHMPPGFTKLYAERLHKTCRIQVKEAENGDIITAGNAYIAPGGMQMEVIETQNGRTIRCAQKEKVNGHSPSVDVLFRSVAKTAGKDAIGVLLTGMGKDGANGLLSMKQSGAYTLAQDEKSCVVYGMPKEAVTVGAVDKVVPLSNIAEELIRRISD